MMGVLLRNPGRLARVLHFLKRTGVGLRTATHLRPFNKGAPTMNRMTHHDGNGHRRVLSASSLAGTSVKNRQGDDLGKIEEIMLDHTSGDVAYAVLSFGGFLGMGDKLFAIPWETLQIDLEDESFVLPVEKEVLESAPGFDKDEWPDFADPTWGGRVHKHYSSTPYWERTSRSQ